MKKLIVACGCSFTYGHPIGWQPSGNGKPIDEIKESYSEILSKKLNCDLINLSKPGASNYFISKQIEHSINLNPNLVIIGATTPLRFDFVGDNLELRKKPTYDNFNPRNIGHLDDKIESRTILWFKEAKDSMEKFDIESRKKFTNVYNFLCENTNMLVKEDQDRLILLGSLFLLKKFNIPFVVVDFSDIFLKTDMDFLEMNYAILSKKYPLKHDPYHFNSDGHVFLSNEILKYINLNLLS